MKTIKQNNSLLEKLFFPPTFGLRVFYHITFWVLYIALHYSYALPTLFRHLPDNTITLYAFLYFSKVIPEYYLCIWLFHVLDKRVEGFPKFCILILFAILLNNIFSTLIFRWTDYAYGLKSMPSRVQIYAELYLTSFRLNDIKSWLVLTNDLSEIQFFMVPITLKMAKYALRESMMRQKVQNEALHMELMLLKSQINPHFVFNVINAAYSKILPVSEDAAEYLQKVSNILRFSLYEATEEFIQLKKELSYVSQYVELESIRNNRRCNITFVQKGRLKNEHKIPTLLLITLVENSFKHGVHATRFNSYVDIHAEITSDTLYFTIVNSRPNQLIRKKSHIGYTGGLGLTNLQKRMQLYYKDNSTFETRVNDQEFKVMLKLSLLI